MGDWGHHERWQVFASETGANRICENALQGGQFLRHAQKMSGIVATHTRLKARTDCNQLKQAAAEFGSSMLDCHAYMSWPQIDIGYGFS